MSWPTEGALVALDSIKALNAGISFISALTFTKGMTGEKFADLLFTAHGFSYILRCCQVIEARSKTSDRRPKRGRDEHCTEASQAQGFLNASLVVWPFVYMTTARWRS